MRFAYMPRAILIALFMFTIAAAQFKSLRTKQVTTKSARPIKSPAFGTTRKKIRSTTRPASPPGTARIFTAKRRLTANAMIWTLHRRAPNAADADGRAGHEFETDARSNCASTIADPTRGRIIDVSNRAAKLLGFSSKGTARVRVQFEGRADVGASPPQDEDEVVAGASNVKAAPVSGISRGELAPPDGAAVAAARTSQPAAAATPSPTMAPIPDTEPDGVVTSVAVPGTTQLWI